MRRVLNSSIHRVKRSRKLRITSLGNKELQVLISLLCGLGFLRKLTNQNLNRRIGLFLCFILFQRDFELILGLLIALNYYLIVTLFLSVILNSDDCQMLWSCRWSQQFRWWFSSSKSIIEFSIDNFLNLWFFHAPYLCYIINNNYK